VGRLPDAARYQLTDEFVARAIAGEIVLVPLRQQIGQLEDLYTMNEVAAFIWERLAEQRTVGQIAAALEATFAADPAEMRRDLEEFLEALLAIRAIRPSEPAPGGLDPTPPR
jgi:hypothetical protein